MGKYISILREEWGERFLWLDAGDQFQGGLESRISDNNIIIDFFNIMKLNASTVGNHEWDYGIDVLQDKINRANYFYIIDNIKNGTNNNKKVFQKQYITKIFKVGKVKIGVIGLVTIKTPNKSTADFKNIKFLDYKQIIIEESRKLRKETDIILLLSHFGIECYKQSLKERNTYNIYSKKDKFTECDDNEELYSVLEYLTTKEVDVIVSGHTHFNVHQFFNDIPVISNWQTKKVMYMNGMFYNCTSLKFLPDISVWNTEGLTQLNNMFCQCFNLSILPDISKWNVNLVTDLSNLFESCTKLTALPDISKWNTVKVSKINHLFYNCSSLESVPNIFLWNMTNLKEMKEIFYGCLNLKTLPNLNNLDTPPCICHPMCVHKSINTAG